MLYLSKLYKTFVIQGSRLCSWVEGGGGANFFGRLYRRRSLLDKDICVDDYSLQIYRKNRVKIKKSWKITVQKMFFVFSRFVIFRFSYKEFSVQCHSIHLVFFLFNRAHQDAGHHRALFLNKLWLYYIYRDLCSWTPIFAHFVSHWTCEPFFSTKKVKIKKKGSVVPCILMCSIKQKKTKLIEWHWTENSLYEKWLKNRLFFLV